VRAPPSSESVSASSSSVSKPSGAPKAESCALVRPAGDRPRSLCPCECDNDRPAFGVGCSGMENGKAPEPSLMDGDGVLSTPNPPKCKLLAPSRASRAALRCAAFSILKLPRFWVDQMPPPRPGTSFSLRGSTPKEGARGQGRSSSDDATASESGVSVRNVVW